MKKFRIIFLFLLSLIVWQLPVNSYKSYAQDSEALVSLSKQIMEAKNNEDLYTAFEQLKDSYFKENKYSQFVDFLNSLSQQKWTLAPFANYYIGLAHYSQLKYLEKTQAWDEYFNRGNEYRGQLTASLQKTIDSTDAKDALNIYARLLLWQFHKDQQDPYAEAALSELMNTILAYSKEASDIRPIKAAADKLLEYAENGKSKQLYAIYVDKLAHAVKEDKELEGIAANFYKEGNLELAEAVYDIYIDRITKALPKEKLIPALINIARDFSYKDEGQKDPPYAEKIFAKIEETGTKEALDEELTYLRAYNAEKMKDYSKAKDAYLDLANRYPKSKFSDEAVFKTGIIYTYIFGDIKAGRDYFGKLAKTDEALSPQDISSLYQLGLLSQWENNLTAAKDYYDKLVEKAGNDFPETVAQANERLKEITDAKPMEFNLKSFLDASLKGDNSVSLSATLYLSSSRYRAGKGENIKISCAPYLIESGCMQVEVQYFWSGDLGTAKPTPETPGFTSAYAQPGTKVINLVILSPGGVPERGIEITDVY